MKLPHPLLESPFFIFSSVTEFKRALEGEVDDYQIGRIDALVGKGLPPIVSRSALAAMFGVSPGLIWSFISRPKRYYRIFEIPKGRGSRVIHAPRVALKIIQKWMSVQLEKAYVAPDHVYGFVHGRSHIMAAQVHQGASWVFSVDIEDFFQSTSPGLVTTALQELGYNKDEAVLIASLCCFTFYRVTEKEVGPPRCYSGLSQGSPASPILSNICFQIFDSRLHEIAMKFGVRLTRYADDIVFSGKGEFPAHLKDEVSSLFEIGCWRLADHKTELLVWPKQRLKVHGLLVHGAKVRLTKGYRNRIRGFQHMLALDRVRPEDVNRLQGHVNYSRMVSRLSGESD